MAVRKPPALDYVWTVDPAGNLAGSASLELSGFKGKGTLSFNYRLVAPTVLDFDDASTLTVIDAESDVEKIMATPSTSDEWIPATVAYTKNTAHELLFVYQQMPDSAVRLSADA